MNNFSILVPSLKTEEWHDDFLKLIPKNYSDFVEIKFTEIQLHTISGCFHSRYANRTWMQALLNLKRFKFDHVIIDQIENSTIKAHQIGEEIYIFDHHRPIIARFLGYSSIKTELYIYK